MQIGDATSVYMRVGFKDASANYILFFIISHHFKKAPHVNKQARCVFHVVAPQNIDSILRIIIE